MRYLPINIDLRDKAVVVTGGGTVAARKAELALRAGARVTAIAPEFGAEFEALSSFTGLSLRTGAPKATDFHGAVVVFVGDEAPAEAKRICALARGAGALVNIPDKPELCDFTMPAIVDRSPLLVAVSSAGASPLLARLVKEQLESTIPAAYGQLARFMGDIRHDIENRIPDALRRRHFLERLLGSPVAEQVLQGDEARARALLAVELDTESKGESAIGEVYLVGGGPGDPDLLTFRAMRLLQRSDVVVYDRLIGSPILELVRRDAERIYVGKQKGRHELTQEEICRLLVQQARQGKRVLRLKGGDPFMFGRGGEEIEALAAERIPFQVVPGVTAALGGASYAGIPLTHRDHAQACVFVTGHGKNGVSEMDYAALIRPQQTVVIYMGLAVLAALMDGFIAHGADPTLPVAVVDNATRPSQRVVTGTLADIASKVSAASLRGPAVTIVGTVVSLRDKLDWFGSKGQAATPNV